METPVKITQKQAPVRSAEEVDPPDLESFNITVLGRFNGHIIEPAWAAKHQIILPGDFEVMMQVGGSPPLYRLPSGLAWTVHPDRLVLFGNKADAPDFLDKLLQTLPHTPLVAAGVNFRNATRDKSAPNTRANSLERILPGAPVQAAETRVFEFPEDVKLTVSVSWSGDERVAITNFHMTSADHRTLAEHAKRAREFEDAAEKILGRL
jgi:hypothetical protein